MKKPSKRTKSLPCGKLSAEEWNEKYPVGTPVRYWPVLPHEGVFAPIDSTTRTPAWALGHGAVVVSIVGKSGGVALSHIEVLPGKAPLSEMEMLVKPKGSFNGTCNRTACQALGATWFNQAMASSLHASAHKEASNCYYCEQCAVKINGFNSESSIWRVVGPNEQEHPWYGASSV
jgi:hypothetical protein